MSTKKPTTAQLLKRTPNYVQLEFSYNNVIILPYEEGMSLINAFRSAESYDNEDYNNPKIVPLIQSSLPRITAVNQSKYLNLKMAALLGVNPDIEENKDELF